MSVRSFADRLFGSRFLCRAAAALLLLGALAWSRPALCGEIHDAARSGDLAKVRELLKANPRLVFSKDADGTTPLHLAVSEDRQDVAKFLLAHHADVNAQANNGATPLHYAASYGRKALAELLLANQARVDARDNYGQTPLHYAAAEGHADVAEALLAGNAEINAKDHSGQTPFDLAANHSANPGSQEVLLFLRRHGGRYGFE